MSGFTKLFSSITSSSIWNEDDKTRLVWITMLAMSTANGMVHASVGGLAHTARVTREDCEKALAVLESPDPDSRSPEFEGRRIEKIDGGFRLLNYAKYREARSDDERRLYMREYMKGYRKQGVNKRKQSLAGVNHGKPPLAHAEAEAEAETPPNPQGGMERKRIAAIFHRRPETEWTDKEDSAFRKLTINPEDLAVVEAYYAAHWPPEREKNILRHDIKTFLNNYPGEVDRARNWKATKQQPQLPIGNGERPDPPEWRDFLKTIPDRKYETYHYSGEHLKDMFRDWKKGQPA